MSTYNFVVNTTLTSVQSEPSSVRLADGSLVIAWTSLNQDGDSTGVYFQRLSKDGLPVGGETQVNTTTTSNQGYPSIGALKDGGFVMIWRSNLQDGDAAGIFGQKFDRFGEKVGSEFQVNTTSANNQYNSEVTGLEGGGFVVTWTDSDADGDQAGIFQQQYSALGIPVGPETQVNATSIDFQGDPVVTSLQNGGWVVAWTSEHLGAMGAADREIFFQKFNKNGVAVGAEQQVSFGGATREDNPSITTLDNGDFVITWFQNFSGDAQIYGRVFKPNGTPRSAEFTVSDPGISDTQGFPMITSLDDGGFAVAWQDFKGSYFMYHRLFDADGTARGDQEVTGAVGNDLGTEGSTIVGLLGGGFGVFWESDSEEIYGAFHGRGTDLDDFEQMASAGEYHALDGNDYVLGSSGDDVIFGGFGIDILNGGDGDDWLEAGNNSGNLTAELLNGGNGNDILIGSHGVDRIMGDAGNDILIGRKGDDDLNGGTGHDVIRGYKGNDDLKGGTGSDKLYGGVGDDTLYGDNGNDRLLGRDGDDSLRGDGGDDRLQGGTGNDDLDGGTNDDLLRGGLGDDLLIGGDGADQFVYKQSGFGSDTIVDFENGIDKIAITSSTTTQFSHTTRTIIGNDVLVEFDGGEILILNMAGSLNAADFIF